MFCHVNRRFIRTLIYVLVAGLAPIASAMGQGAGAGVVAAEMPCADSMPHSNDSKPCPCCPDGTSNMAACLSACTASAAALPASAVQVVRAIEQPSPVAAFPQISDLADPPLKPPPIV